MRLEQASAALTQVQTTAKFRLTHCISIIEKHVVVYCCFSFVTQHPCLCDTAAGKKKNVNVGSKGGSAGLDDYKYDTPLDDADDFM